MTIIEMAEKCGLVYDHFGKQINNTATPDKLEAFANLIRADERAKCKLPDGWVTVPVEPTKDMLNASYVPLYQAPDLRDTTSQRATKVYKAMLQAAPNELKD
jgi:hypothetical protein